MNALQMASTEPGKQCVEFLIDEYSKVLIEWKGIIENANNAVTCAM